MFFLILMTKFYCLLVTQKNPHMYNVSFSSGLAQLWSTPMITPHTGPIHYWMFACLNTCAQHASLHCFHERAVRVDDCYWFSPCAIVEITPEREGERDRVKNHKSEQNWPFLLTKCHSSTVTSYKIQTYLFIQALLVIVYTTYRSLMQTDKWTILLTMAKSFFTDPHPMYSFNIQL